jgi:hypothetical protein
MLDTTTKSKSTTTKEKIKWSLVAVLSVLLIMVLYFNLKPSRSGEKTLALQGQVAEALDHSIPSMPENELMPPLEALMDDGETTNPAISLLIQDIFSFAARGNAQNRTAMDTTKAEDIILKGTIIDGDNSVAFLNDAIVGLGNSFNGFIVVEITANKAVIKNEEEEITLLVEDGLDEKLQR